MPTAIRLYTLTLQVFNSPFHHLFPLFISRIHKVYFADFLYWMLTVPHHFQRISLLHCNEPLFYQVRSLKVSERHRFQNMAGRSGPGMGRNRRLSFFTNGSGFRCCCSTTRPTVLLQVAVNLGHTKNTIT